MALCTPCDSKGLYTDHSLDCGAERAEKVADEDNEAVDPDQPVFSLISGTYRHARRYGGKSYYRR